MSYVPGTDGVHVNERELKVAVQEIGPGIPGIIAIIVLESENDVLIFVITWIGCYRDCVSNVCISMRIIYLNIGKIGCARVQVIYCERSAGVIVHLNDIKIRIFMLGTL